MSTIVHSHFGVYALIQSKKSNSVLVIEKARGPYTGRYDLPGGSPEGQELLEETLVREVMEETGCDILEMKQLAALSAKFSYSRDKTDALLRHIGVIYEAQVSADIKLDADGEDSLGCRWVSIDELTDDNATPFIFMAIEAVEKRDSVVAALISTPINN